LIQDDLERLGRSLALQLGIRVVISDTTDQSQHQFSNVIDREPSSPPSTPQPNTTSVAIEPTVYTVLTDKPFSNIYETLPTDILARIYAKGIIQQAEDTHSQPVMTTSANIRAALQSFSLSKREAKIHTFDGLMHLVIEATPDIVEEQVFYDLTRELAHAAGSKSLVLTITQNKTPDDKEEAPALSEAEVLEAKLPPVDLTTIDISELKNTVQAAAFSKTLREEIGTNYPYTVSYEPTSGRCFVQLLYKRAHSATLDSLISEIIQLADDFSVPAVVQLRHAPRNSLILNQGKRSSVSHDEMLKMAALLRANLHITEGAEWATITPEASVYTAHGNCIEISPKITLTPSLLRVIRDASAHIPCPILLHPVKPSQEPLSIDAVKAVTKLLLPPGASIESVRSHPAGKVSLHILSSRSSWSELARIVSAPFKAIDQSAQLILFSCSERPAALCEALAACSDVHRKTFIRNMTPDGKIAIRDLQLPPAKSVKLRDVSWNSLQERYPQIINRIDLPVSLWDSAGTSRAEDGISLTVEDGILTQGIHFANAAIQLDQFSVERHRAYQRGDSVYITDQDLAAVSHMMPGLGKYTFREGSITPALSVFIDYKLDGLDDPAAIAESISKARVEPTFVRPSTSYLYPQESSESWLLRLPKRAQSEMRLLAQIEKALRIHAIGADQSTAAAPTSPRSSVRSSIYLANHVLATMLQNSELPVLYQTTPPPSSHELKSCLLAIRHHQHILPELSDFVDREPAEIENDPTLLNKLYAIARSLPNSRRALCNFPRLEQVVLPTADRHLLSGYSPFVAANTGFRKLPSLVAQHQLNACLGLLSPLSYGEVNSLYARHLHHIHSDHFDKIERDLRTIGLLKYLKQHENTPLVARVIKAPHMGSVEIDADLPFKHGVRCRLNLTLQSSTLGPLQVGDVLRVIPTYYSPGEDTLIFQPADLTRHI
jgi:hypothetical protein